MKPVALAVSRPRKPQRRTGYSRQDRHSSAEPVMAASSSWRGSMPATGSDRPSVDKPAPDARRVISAIGEAPRLQRGLQRAAPRGSGTIEAGDCSTPLLPAVPWQRAALRQKSSHSSHSRDPPPHHSSTSKMSGKDTTNGPFCGHEGLHAREQDMRCCSCSDCPRTRCGDIEHGSRALQNLPE